MSTMFLFSALTEYEDDSGEIHVEEYCYKVHSITEGVNLLQNRIDVVEERYHWTFTDVDIKHVVFLKGETDERTN